MRFRTSLFAMMLLAGAAQAQVVSPLGGSTSNPQGAAPPAAPTTTTTTTPTPNPAPDAAARTAARRRPLPERFAAANTTHDGKLTRAQARAARMMAVVRDFAEIDKTNRGYVTLDEIRAFQQQRRAAHRASRSVPKPP